MNTTRIAALLLCAAAIGTPLALRAQTQPVAQTLPAGTAEHHHGNPLMKALKTLSLTPAQQQQISGFVAASKQANVDASTDERRANRKKLREEIMGVLTPGQQAKLKATLQQERQAQGQPPSGT
jgi:Spy/CpxP family protein refolding chaperone